jgi:hypothetical protein
MLIGGLNGHPFHSLIAMLQQPAELIASAYCCTAVECMERTDLLNHTRMQIYKVVENLAQRP